MIAEFIANRRSDILLATGRHGAKNVRVFGSAARGEHGPSSNVDFLVDLEPGRSLLDHAALILELEAILGRKVDVVTEKGLKDKIRADVLRDAMPLEEKRCLFCSRVNASSVLTQIQLFFLVYLNMGF